MTDQSICCLHWPAHSWFLEWPDSHKLTLIAKSWLINTDDAVFYIPPAELSGISSVTPFQSFDMLYYALLHFQDPFNKDSAAGRLPAGRLPAGRLSAGRLPAGRLPLSFALPWLAFSGGNCLPAALVTFRTVVACSPPQRRCGISKCAYLRFGQNRMISPFASRKCTSPGGWLAESRKHKNIYQITALVTAEREIPESPPSYSTNHLQRQDCLGMRSLYRCGMKPRDFFI